MMTETGALHVFMPFSLAAL